MVTGLVDDAVAHGARVIHGGRSVESEGGYYYEPTILADVEPHHADHAG
jgi:acyl-CoA reductase-like NAD-dependent aldehyde dehydrogenase